MNAGPWGKPPPARRRASRLGVIVWVSVLAGLGAILWALTQAFPDQRDDMNNAYLWRLVAILAVASSGLLFIRDINIKKTTRNIVGWIGIAGVLLIGFSYQEELLRVALRVRSDLVPGYPVETANREMMISESANGDYFVYGTVGGTPVKFVVDTGASDIVLSPEDARRAGIDLDRLNFDHSYETANGIGRGAAFTVPSLTVGGVALSDVAVSINQTNMGSSLLGMTFLRRLKSFGFSDRKLLLRW
jgi:aspartyl protease family protein